MAPKDVPLLTLPFPPPLASLDPETLGRTARPGVDQCAASAWMAGATDGRCRALGACLCLGYMKALPTASQRANNSMPACPPAKKTRCKSYRTESSARGTISSSDGWVVSAGLAAENPEAKVRGTQKQKQTQTHHKHHRSMHARKRGPLCIFHHHPSQEATCPLPSTSLHAYPNPPAYLLPLPISPVAETRASRAWQGSSTPTLAQHRPGSCSARRCCATSHVRRSLHSSISVSSRAGSTLSHLGLPDRCGICMSERSRLVGLKPADMAPVPDVVLPAPGTGLLADESRWRRMWSFRGVVYKTATRG